MKYTDNLYSKLLNSKQTNPNLYNLYKKFRNRVDKDIKDSKTGSVFIHCAFMSIYCVG